MLIAVYNVELWIDSTKFVMLELTKKKLYVAQITLCNSPEEDRPY